MSADKLISAFRAKIAKRKREVIERILQLNHSTMQELGEHYTQYKAELYGLQQAEELAEGALTELLGGERPDESNQETRSIY